MIEKMPRFSAIWRSKHVVTAVALLTTIYLMICFANAIACRPPLDGDSWIFAIPAIEYPKDGLIRNAYWMNDAIPGYDPNIFAHGNLYPIVLGELAPIAGFPGIYLANFILFLLYVLLFIAFCFSTPSVNPFVASGSFLLALAIIVPSKFVPDIFAAIVILLWILCLRWTAPQHRALRKVIPITALSTLSATHPPIAILSAAFLVYWMIYRDGTKSFGDLALIGAGSAVGAAILNQIITGRLLEWISALVAFRNTWTIEHPRIITEYLLSTDHFLLLFGLLVAVALICLLHAAKLRQEGTLTNKLLLSAAGLVSIPLVYYVGRGLPPVVDNIAPFIPIAIVLLWYQSELLSSRIAKWGLTIALAISVFGATVSLARNMAVATFGLIRNDVVSYFEFTTAIRHLLETHSEVAIDLALFSALPHEHRPLVGVFTTAGSSSLGPISDPTSIPAAACTLVIKQSSTGYEHPPAIAGFTLVEDHFAPGQRALGFTISRTPKSYNYAVYRRQADFCR
jgi:hypothetical protein